jgi:aspartate 1-decarboxylase
MRPRQGSPSPLTPTPNAGSDAERAALRSVLRGKIHRAVVTEANLNYVGSITIDRNLMDAAGIDEWEQVHVLDITNGARLETYAIPGERGSGEICMNGAAAHLVHPGDLVIILTYEWIPSSEVSGHAPRIVHVTANNQPLEVVEAEHPGTVRL